MGSQISPEPEVIDSPPEVKINEESISTKYKWLTKACWILFILQALGTYGQWVNHHPRDPAIHRMMVYPEGSHAIVVGIAYLVGCNLFGIPALLLSITLYIKSRRQKGGLLIFLAITIIVIEVLLVTVGSTPEVPHWSEFSPQ